MHVVSKPRTSAFSRRGEKQIGSHRRERMDAEEQYQQRRHQRAATHAGQTDESADNKTGEWIEPVHDRYTSALESGFRSFRSVACLSEVIGAFLRAERGHRRAGNGASFVMPVRSQPAPGAIVPQSRGGSRSPRTI
jgi:hypothetical protein